MFSMFGWACCACAFNVSPFPRVDFAPCVCVRACLRACVGMCYVNSTFYPSCLFETRSASSFFSSALVGLLLVGVGIFACFTFTCVVFFMFASDAKLFFYHSGPGIQSPFGL